MPPQNRVRLRSTPSSIGQRDQNRVRLRNQTESYKPYNKMSKEEKIRDKEKFWDSMPVWWKKGYNDSLGGMMHEMMTGQKYYDLRSAPPNQVEDFAAMFASFFASKEDLALMATSAGVANVVAKVGMSQIAKQSSKGLLKRNVAAQLAKGSNLSYKTSRVIVDDVVEQGLPQMAFLGLHDGLHKSAARLRDEMVKSGNTIELKTGKEFDRNGGFLGGSWTDKENFALKAYAMNEVMVNSKFKDYAKGGAMGLLGGTARALRALPSRGIEKLAAEEIVGRKAVGEGRSVIRKGALKLLEGVTGKKKGAGIFYESMTFSGLQGPIYEGRAPEFSDLASGLALAGALSVPGRTMSYGKGKFNEKLGFELGKYETEQMLQLSAEAQRYGGMIRYSLLNVPTKGAKGPVIKGTNLQVKKSLEDSGTKAPKEAIGNRRVSVVQDSIAQDAKGNLTMKVKVGKGDGKQAGIMELDARNTKKFFDFYVERPNQYKKDYGLLIGKRKGELTKFDKVRNDKVIQVLEKNSKEGKNGYQKSDWDDAIRYLAGLPASGKTKGAQFKKLAAMVKSGKEVKLKDMNDATKAVLARYVDDAKYIREFVNKNALTYNVTRLFNPQGLLNKDKGFLSKALTIFKPAYSQLDSKYAKMALRMLDEVSIGAQNKTAIRYAKLDEIMGMGDISVYGKTTARWWGKYLTEGEAWNDLNKINQLDRLNKNSKGRQTVINDLKKQMESGSLSKAEKDKLKLKIEFLPKMKEYTDEIFNDAKSVGIDVADYVESYVPFMFKKEVLDVLFDGTKQVEDKIKEIVGPNGLRTDKSYGKQTVKEINKAIEELVLTFDKQLKKKGKAKGSDFKSMFNKLMETRADGTKPDAYDAYATMAMGLESLTKKQFAPLEKSRSLGNTGVKTGEFTRIALERRPDLYEKNIVSLFQDYTAGSTKRIEMARAFTPSYKLLDNLKNKIGDTKIIASQLPGYSAKTEKQALELAVDIFTGDINFNKELTFSKWLQSVNNLEMLTKIASGFAPIVNVTQTTISSMIISPFAASKSMFELARNINVGKGKNKTTIREWVRETGATVRTAFEELMVADPYIQQGASTLKKYGENPTMGLIRDVLFGSDRKQAFRNGIDFIRDSGELIKSDKSGTVRRAIAKTTQFGAKWSGFNKINEINQVVAAASAEQLVINFTKILSGKKVGLGILDTLAPAARKRWASKSLRRMGLNEKEILANSANVIGRNYDITNVALKQKIQRSMVKFALDSQMQRSFTRDPFFFNDPNMKSLFLFKRFGYRQATYMKAEVEREVLDGNIMPILQLGMAGLVGGSSVMWAREKYSELITGEEQYYGRNNRRKMLEQPDWQDFISGMGNVGSFGMITDVLNDEQPSRVGQRFITPVQWDDLKRVLSSANEVSSNYNLYPNMKDVPWRKGMVKLLPILGGIPGRFLKKGVETEAMTKDRIRGNKRRVVEHIRELIEQGNNQEAVEVMDTFNLVFATKDIERGSFAKAFGLREDTYRGYPSLRITYADFSPNIMEKRYYKSLLKEKKEKVFIP